MARPKSGALWKRQGKQGEYLSGEVQIGGTKMKIVAFPNTYKEKDNQPDFVVYEHIARDKPEPAPQEETELEPF